MTNLPPLLHQFEIAPEIPERGASSWQNLFGSSFGQRVQQILGGAPALAQEQFIAAANQRQDLLYCVRTGGGKTTTLMIWMLHQIWKRQQATANERGDKAQHPFQAVVLLPTNSLLHDFEERLRGLASKLGVAARTAAYTRATSVEDRRKLRNQAPELNIVLLTPDMWQASLFRNWVLGERGHAANKEWACRLLAPDLLVIEEFDVLRGSALAALHLLLPVIRQAAVQVHGTPPQVILTSATATNPEELCSKLLPSGVSIRGRGRHGRLHILCVSRVQRAPHGWHDSLDDVLESCLRYQAEQGSAGQMLVIIDNRREAEEVFLRLRLAERGFEIVHGDLNQMRNRVVIDRFKRGEVRGLLTTTIINRGIDIGDLNLLVLVGIPTGGLRDVIQSLGRIARRSDGAGLVYHLLDRRRSQEEALARDSQRLESLYRGAVAPVTVPEDRHYAAKLAVLAALLLGCGERQALPKLFPPGMQEWLPPLVVGLRGQGLLRYSTEQFVPTGGTDECIHQLSLRGGRREFEVNEVRSGRRIAQIDVTQVSRAGLPGNRLLLGGQIYRVASTTSGTVEVEPTPVTECSRELVSDNTVDASLSLTLRGCQRHGAFTFQKCDFHQRLTPTRLVLRDARTMRVMEEQPIPPTERIHLALEPLEGFTIQTEGPGRILMAHTLGCAILAVAYLESATELQVLLAQDCVVVGDRPGAPGAAGRLYEQLPSLLPRVTELLSGCRCQQAGCPDCIYLAAPASWRTDRSTIQRTLSLLQVPILPVVQTANSSSQPSLGGSSWEAVFGEADGRREVELVFADLHIGHPASHWPVALECLNQLLKKYRVFGIYFAGDSVELRFAHEAASANDKEAKTTDFAIGWETVQSAFDDFARRLQRLGVEDRCVFITGNHDTGLELLPRSHGLTITQGARLDCDSYSVHVLHGHGLGLEAAAQRWEGGAAALRAVRARLERNPPLLIPRVQPPDWLVIGHYGIGVCDATSRVAALGDWTGNLYNPVKACYAVVEPTNAEAPVRLGRWRNNLA